MEAEVCSRCGHSFTPTGRMRPLNGLRRSRPSIPPASPHRAGHYSGLHPEDQPYQSSVMAVQHAPVRKSEQWRRAEQEEDSVILPAVETVETVEDVQELNGYESASGFAATQGTHPFMADVPLQQADTHERATRGQPYRVPTRMTPPPAPNVASPSIPLAPRRSFPKKPGPQKSLVPIILTISCLLLLVVGSLFVYTLIAAKPQPSVANHDLTATPNSLRVTDTFTLSGRGFGANDLIKFTHDPNDNVLDGNGKPLQVPADDIGTFSVRIVVPADWKPGQHRLYAIDEGQQFSDSVVITILQASSAPPHLQLSDISVDLGANAPGAVSNRNITLTNTGGGQLSWQASSDKPWLTISPNNGTFSGSALAVVTVNRGTLAPMTYTGHILFRQQGSSNQPLRLTAMMKVNPTPVSLSVSPVSLTYSGTTTQNPAAQTIVIQNSSGQQINWTSAVVTGDGAPWLSISPNSGYLPANSSAILTVSVQSQHLAVGSYQGTINFTGGANPQVSVALSVVAIGNNLVASPPSLNFTTTTGQNPAGQTITIQNSGGHPLDWSVSATTTDGANWLSATPGIGHLELGAQANVTINVNAVALKPNAYQGMLTFTYGTLTKQVAVALTVSPPPAAAISLAPSTLNFSTIKGTNPASQTFTITNTGNATLNWTITEDQNGTNFFPVTPSSGSLAPGKSAIITVNPNVTGASAGMLTAIITVLDSDTGTTVQSQKVSVNIAVSDQAVINVSGNSMSFGNTSTLNDTFQLLVITNTGSEPLNWVIQPSSSSASWLSADITSGTLAPGEHIVVQVQCSSSQLAVGTYTGTLVVSDSDAGTPVAPQTINVTLAVSQ